MDAALLDYDLPADRIAQHPASRRDAARLMRLGRHDGDPTHHVVSDLPDLLRPGDLLVLNDTRVVPARLFGSKETGGRVELLVLPPPAGAPGESGDAGNAPFPGGMAAGPPSAVLAPCLVSASRRPLPGQLIHLPAGWTATVQQDGERGAALVRFERVSEAGPRTLMDLLAAHGVMPLPPYIRRAAGEERDAGDDERYQTVFARHPGAVAAPTAGLHFTPSLLESLRDRGADIAYLTLHVGPGTFRPLTAPRVEDHILESETFDLPEATAAAIAGTRARRGRVIACGTTVVRVLEDRALPGGQVRAGAGACGLLIVPGHAFRVVDGMLTNFHLPRTSLLALVAAFAGRARLLAAYAQAVAAGYRFYSYGDAMVIEPAEASVPVRP